MKHILFTLAILPSTSFACPDLAGTYNCNGGMIGPETTALSITISKTNDVFNFTKTLFGMHEASDGGIAIGSYTRSDEFKLGVGTEKFFDASGELVAKQISSLICENNKMTWKKEIRYAGHEYTVTREEGFSKNQNGELVHTTTDYSWPLVCTPVN